VRHAVPLQDVTFTGGVEVVLVVGGLAPGGVYRVRASYGGGAPSPPVLAYLQGTYTHENNGLYCPKNFDIIFIRSIEGNKNLFISCQKGSG
jgi:hypothetical protein